MSGPDLSDEATQAKLKEITPTVYLYERARQIQEQVLPMLEEQKENIEAAIHAHKVEMQVLEAASKVIPPDRIPIGPPDNIAEFDPQSAGGVN